MKPQTLFALENAPWPALLLDASGVVRRANQAALELFGTVMEENFTQMASIWSPENEAKAGEFLAWLEQSRANSLPLKFRVKGGSTGRFATSICIFKQGEQNHFLFQLLPEHSEAKPAGAESNLAQKQKLDCALQLTRTVALDFNNALTSILGHTSLILSQMPAENAWRKSLIEVEKAAEKAAEIAYDLAAFSRPEKDSQILAAGNLNDLLRRTVELFQQAGSKPIEWKLRLQSRLYSAVFDEAKMQQALMKVLENAVQAVGDSGVIYVQTSNRDLEEPFQDGTANIAPGRYICLDISDNGSGIAPEVLARIFEPFFTTKPGHRGLGLAWTYGIVTNHGGTIVVTSGPTRGTTVRLYLPALKKIIKDKNFQDNELKGRETILMVDDEEVLLTMGEMILSSYGYKVLTANSGQKALEIMGQPDNEVSLVITDLVMPHMSGRELIERLRLFAPEIRVLCSSGYVRPSPNEEDDYLQKPFTSRELLSKVKQALA